MLHTGEGNRGPVATQNVAAFMALATKLIERDPDTPGLGVFYGFSGYGKTYASIFAQNRTRAIRIEVSDFWTRKTLLQSILVEAGQPARGTIADMAGECMRVLGDEPSRPLIIDEADLLVERGLIETVRTLHNKSGAPFILIGEELFPEKLEPYERVHGRVLDFVAAEPADIDDARTFARSICRGITVAEDLLEEIVRASAGSARRIVVNLVKALEIARCKGLSTLDLSGWGGEAYFTGRSPKPRALTGGGKARGRR